MKRSAKHIDIKNPQTVMPWVVDCVQRHYKRHDFRDMLIKHGMKKDDYYEVRRTHDRAALTPYCKAIAEDACRRIASRNLKLPEIKIRERVDQSSGKVRQIGNESAMQQVLDYIAVYGAMEIFDRRIVLAQVSSIKGRGQKLGVKLIRSFIGKDNRAAMYAKEHGMAYSRRSTFFCKLDIRKCFPSARLEAFMRLFERDCANGDLLWLWETLLKSHKVAGYSGFMIGALPSCWAIQYMLSFVYRKAMAMHYTRRGRSVRVFHKGVFFMDDMLLFGASRNRMRKGISELARYAKEMLELEVKGGWHIRRLHGGGREEAVDMMGYVVHADGRITIRKRLYKKIRRILLRYNAGGAFKLKQAKRACSYKGFLTNSCHGKVEKKYNAFRAIAQAAKVVGENDKTKAGAINV